METMERKKKAKSIEKRKTELKEKRSVVSLWCLVVVVVEYDIYIGKPSKGGSPWNED